MQFETLACTILFLYQNHLDTIRDSRLIQIHFHAIANPFSAPRQICLSYEPFCGSISVLCSTVEMDEGRSAPVMSSSLATKHGRSALIISTALVVSSC
jgi:hypothetical protein